MWPSKYKYDAFISHAVEDKLPIANELCRRLESAGLKIWYSGKELMVGDNLEKTIHKGLAQSRYGVVILSQKYLEKNWPMREFYVLLAKEIEHRKVILPVLYDISMDELQERNMDMADKWSIPYNKGMDFVINKITNAIKQPEKKMTFWEWVEENIYALKFWFFIFVIAMLLSVVIYGIIDDYPPDNLVQSSIENRMNNFMQEIARGNKLALNSGATKISSTGSIMDIYSTFMNLHSSGYRNEYEFDNGIQKIRSKKNVENALDINVESLSPHNNYNFTDPMIHFASNRTNNDIVNATYSFVNTKPVKYEITNEELISDGQYSVNVSYQQNLRIIRVELIFPGSSQSLKKHRVTIKGFLPREKYIFEKEGPDWVLKTIE